MIQPKHIGTKKKMAQHSKPTDKDYKGPSIDGYLKSNMDGMKEEIQQDDDKVLMIDGRERIGKSVFGMQIAWYMSDGKLELQDICLTAEEFQKRVKDCLNGTTIIFDECYLGMASADALSKYNRLLMKMLVTCGQKNLCLILILPSVFDISKYVALHRADALLHVFKHKGKRGHFAFYNAQKVKNLYIFGKKFYSYGKIHPNFHGKFSNHYTVNEAEYRKKKLESLTKLLSMQEEDGVGARKETTYRSIKIVKQVTELPNKDIAELLKVHPNTIMRALKWQIPKEINIPTPIHQDIKNTGDLEPNTVKPPINVGDPPINVERYGKAQ